MTDNLFDPDQKGLLNELDNLKKMDEENETHKKNSFTVTLVFSSRVIKINVGLN